MHRRVYQETIEHKDHRINLAVIHSLLPDKIGIPVRSTTFYFWGLVIPEDAPEVYQLVYPKHIDPYNRQQFVDEQWRLARLRWDEILSRVTHL